MFIPLLTSRTSSFQYTTTDAGGNKVVRTATFTPSFAPTTVTFKPAEGSASTAPAACFAEESVTACAPSRSGR